MSSENKSKFDAKRDGVFLRPSVLSDKRLSKDDYAVQWWVCQNDPTIGICPNPHDDERATPITLDIKYTSRGFRYSGIKYVTEAALNDPDSWTAEWPKTPENKSEFDAKRDGGFLVPSVVRSTKFNAKQDGRYLNPRVLREVKTEGDDVAVTTYTGILDEMYAPNPFHRDTAHHVKQHYESGRLMSFRTKYVPLVTFNDPASWNDPAPPAKTAEETKEEPAPKLFLRVLLQMPDHEKQGPHDDRNQSLETEIDPSSTPIVKHDTVVAGRHCHHFKLSVPLQSMSMGTSPDAKDDKEMTKEIPFMLWRDAFFYIVIERREEKVKEPEILFARRIHYDLKPDKYPDVKPCSDKFNVVEEKLKTGSRVRYEGKWTMQQVMEEKAIESKDKVEPLSVAIRDSTIGLTLGVCKYTDAKGKPLALFVDRVYGLRDLTVHLRSDVLSETPRTAEPDQRFEIPDGFWFTVAEHMVEHTEFLGKAFGPTSAALYVTKPVTAHALRKFSEELTKKLEMSELCDKFAAALIFSVKRGTRFDKWPAGKCRICQKPTTKTCAACTLKPSYCGAEHQTQDWPYHKKDCKANKRS